MGAANLSGERMPSWSFRNLLEHRDVDSSSDEDEGPQDSDSEADTEGTIQVQGELLFGKDRALIKALDKWMELASHGKRQDQVDVDMLSALTLNGGVQI